MLATFSLAAGAGAVAAGSFDSPPRRIPLIVGTLVLSVIPLTTMLFVPLGSAAFFALVALGGALLYASGPLMVVVAQDYAPTRHVSAAGMILGFSTGIGGILYMGMGWLQNAVGAEAALLTAFAMAVPAALSPGWSHGDTPCRATPPSHPTSSYAGPMPSETP